MGLITVGSVPKCIQDLSRRIVKLKKEDPVLYDMIKDKPYNNRFDNIDMDGKRID